MLISCLFSTTAFAQDKTDTVQEQISVQDDSVLMGDSNLIMREEKKDIVTYWDLDTALIAVSGVTWLTMELAKDDIAPKTCVWCKSNAVDDRITNALSWDKPNYAAKSADYVDFIGIPVLTLSALALSSGLEGRIEGYPSDLLLMLETITISSLFNEIVKYYVGRERPYVSRGNSGLYNNPSDDNLSFYSGHTNLAFALVVAAGTIANIRDYKAEPYIWGIGIPVATLVAYFRVAGQKHYFTDVLVGAAMGSLVGFLVPWLHRRTVSPGDGLYPKNHISVNYGGNSISVSGTF